VVVGDYIDRCIILGEVPYIEKIVLL